MKKALIPIVALLVLFILLTGCGKKDDTKKPEPPSKRTAHTTSLPVKLFSELKSGVKTNLNAISYFNSARGITVGDNGTILYTKNGGHDWSSDTGVTTVNLYGAAMVDSLIAIAVGEKGQILRSKNGGKTWAAVTSDNVYFHKTLRAVAFYSGKDGYAVGDSGVIFATNDAGEKWTKVHGDSSQTLNGIAYNRVNRPNVVGNKGVFLYGKAAGVWGDASGFTMTNLRSIHFALGKGPYAYSDTGFAVGDGGMVFKTTNGGNSWNSVLSPVTKNLRGVFLLSIKRGYAVGDSGTVLRYNGIKWKPLSSPTIKRLNAVDPVYWNPSSTCVGEDGLIMYINPPAVNDNGSKADLAGQSGGCLWDVTLYTRSLVGRNEEDYPISYKYFEVCSSIEQSDLVIIPGSGWVVRDQFYIKSLELEPDQKYPSEPDHPLCTISLKENPAGDLTSGYFSCYLKDENENFYLLSTYDIQCSP